MSDHEKKILSTLIAKAYSHQKNVPYSTAELLSTINHRLSAQRQKYIGTKFYYYVIKRPAKFKVIRTTSNNKYLTL